MGLSTKSQILWSSDLIPLHAAEAGLGGGLGEPGQGPLASLGDPALMSSLDRGGAALALVSDREGRSGLHTGLVWPRPGGNAAGLGLLSRGRNLEAELGASLGILRTGRLGLALKGGSQDPGDGLGRGWSLGPDLGLLLPFPQGLFRGRGWLSFSLLDPVTRLNRPALPSQALPNRRRLHLGLNLSSSLFLVTGTDHLYDPLSGRQEDAIRVGMAYRTLGERLSLRAGYEAQGGRGLGFTAGLGWKAPVWSADYAWNSGERNSGSRHRLEASWLFLPGWEDPRPRFLARSDRAPGEGPGAPPQLRGVLVETRWSRRPEEGFIQAWKASFSGAEGAVLGGLEGAGAPPEQILWDAKQGRKEALADPEGLKLTMILERRGREPLTVVASIHAGPVLASRPSRVLDIPAQAREGADFWRVEIRSRQGKALRTFSGTGAPPAQLAWDGIDDRGRPVDEKQELDLIVRSAGAERPAFEETRPLGAAGSAEIVNLAVAPPPEPVAEKAVTWSVQVMDDKGRAVKTLTGQGTPPVQIFMERSRGGGAAPDAKVRISYTVRSPAKSGEKASLKRFTWNEGRWLSREVEAEAAEGEGRLGAVRLTAAAFRAVGALSVADLLAGVIQFAPGKGKLSRAALREIERIVSLWENRKESVVCVYGYSASGNSGPLAAEVAKVLAKIMGSGGSPRVRSFGGAPAPLAKEGRGLDKKGTLVEVFLAPKPE